MFRVESRHVMEDNIAAQDAELFREGRKCILIEKDPAYCEIIRRRVREAAGVGSLFEGCA